MFARLRQTRRLPVHGDWLPRTPSRRGRPKNLNDILFALSTTTSRDVSSSAAVVVVVVSIVIFPAFPTTETRPLERRDVLHRTNVVPASSGVRRIVSSGGGGSTCRKRK